MPVGLLASPPANPPNAPPPGVDDVPPKLEDAPRPVVVDDKPPPNAFPVGPGESENIVARKGFAPPAAPVACGLSPTPTVDAPPTPSPELNAVGCEFSSAALPNEPDGVCLGCSEPGVVGADWGIGGSESRRAAPNDEVGLNALSPVNPVVCGCSALMPLAGFDDDDALVALVG